MQRIGLKFTNIEFVHRAFSKIYENDFSVVCHEAATFRTHILISGSKQHYEYKGMTCSFN